MTDQGECVPLIRGRTDGTNHPLWSDGEPILIGQEVTWHVTRDEPWGPRIGRYKAVVHEVACEEVRIGGMDSDDQEWDEQVHPDELTRVPPSGSRVSPGGES